MVAGAVIDLGGAVVAAAGALLMSGPMTPSASGGTKDSELWNHQRHGSDSASVRRLNIPSC